MAAKARNVIISEIEQCIASSGYGFSDWFVGITDKPKHQIFSTHKVRQTGDAWISRLALSDLQAAEIEDYFRSVRKTRGKPGPTTLDHVYVYAYRMKEHTSP